MSGTNGSASIGLEQAILGHTLGFSPMAPPTHVYTALCFAATVPSETVRGIEPAGGGYTRMPSTFALIADASNVAANTTSIEWPAATSDWGTLGYFELWDAPTGGSRLYWGPFSPPDPVIVSAGDIVRFSAGTLGVQASTGTGGTTSIGAYLPLAGGVMSGAITLATDPTDYLQAATKQYVDAHSGAGGGPGFLPLSGGAMLGTLTLAGNATLPMHAVPLQQIDTLNVVNVLNHGAKGDGTTDDTAAIQSALNAYAGKATVFVPDTGHVYVVAALTIPAGTDLLIHGTLLAKANSGTLLFIQNVSNVTVRGHGTLDGNGANQTTTQAVFYTFNATNVKLSGLTLQNSFSWNLNVVQSNNVHVDSVRLLGGKTANEFAQSSSHCWITNSYINGVTADESFSFYSGVTNSGITNCEVSNGFISGITVFADSAGGQVAPCSNIIIANNICHHCRQAGIEVRTGDAGPPVQHTNVTITGNRCYSNSNAGNVWFGEIWLQSGTNLTVTGNALSSTGSGSNGSTGILVGAATSDVTVTGNSIWNIGQGSTIGVGIFLQNAPDVLIEGNHIYDNQGTKTMVAAFSGSAGPRTVIIGNMFDGVSSGLGFGTLGCGLAADTKIAVMDGAWTVGGPVGAATSLIIGASVGFPARLQYESSKGFRWRVGTDGTAEGGSNAGSNYAITPYSDASAALPVALSVNRATGKTTLAVAPTITTLPANAANDAAAAAASVPVGGIYRNGSVLMVRAV